MDWAVYMSIFKLKTCSLLAQNVVKFFNCLGQQIHEGDVPIKIEVGIDILFFCKETRVC